MLRLNLNGIPDSVTRDNFRKIEEAFRVMALLNGNFTLIERTFNQTAETVEVPHNLNFTPTDFIILSAVGDQNYYFIPNDFTDKVVPIYISAPVTIRFLLGRAK